MMLFVHIFHKHSLHFSMKHIETYEKTWKHVTKHLLQALHRVWRRPLLMANEVGGLRLSYCHGNDSNVFKDHSVFFQRKLRCLAGAEIKLCYEGVCVCVFFSLFIDHSPSFCKRRGPWLMERKSVIFFQHHHRHRNHRNPCHPHCHHPHFDNVIRPSFASLVPCPQRPHLSLVSVAESK